MTGFRVSGDAGIGIFEPPDVRTPAFERLPAELLDPLRDVPGLVATVSDVLEERGWYLAIPCSALAPRHSGGRSVIGHAITVGYLPSRKLVPSGGISDEPPRLIHHVAFNLAARGDVIVIDASSVAGISVLGGIAGRSAVARGFSGVIIDGGVRDLDEVADSGIPLWSRYVTPRSGKYRLDGVSVNAPAVCGGVQVLPGDLVVADITGICFVPLQDARAVIDRVTQIAKDERKER